MANVSDGRLENESDLGRTAYSDFERRRRARWRIVVVLPIVLAIPLVVLYKYKRAQIDSGQCGFHLRRLGMALDSYYAQHGAFPPAYVCDRAGNPVNSWRMLILPYGLSYNFPANYEFAERWDSPRNSKLLAPDSPVCQDLFQCASAGSKDPAITNYVAVVGANTMWPGCEGAKKAADGSDNDKILLIEVIDSDIHWNEPRDLTLEQALDSLQPKQGMGIGSHHRDGIHYVTVGGEKRTLDPNIDRESLRKLLVRDSPEVPASLEPKDNGKTSETGVTPPE